MAKRNGPKPIGANLQAARERAQLSRSALAEKVGKSYLWVWKLETENGSTLPETFYLLAELLHVPVDYIRRYELPADGDDDKKDEAPKRQANPTTHPEPNRPAPPPPPRRRNRAHSDAELGAA